MRVLVDGLDTVIEGEVIGGKLLDGQSGRFDLESEFTVRCDDGACFTIHGWLVDVEILNEPAEWVMLGWHDLYSGRSVAPAGTIRFSPWVSVRLVTR